MLYNVEIHEWNESTPDNGIWQGDIFPDLTEANSEAEAIRQCIDYYMEEADWSTTDHDPDSIEVKADFKIRGTIATASTATPTVAIITVFFFMLSSYLCVS